MKAEGKRALLAGAGLTGAFMVWTILIQRIDVRAAGQNGTNIGFAAFNLWFHRITGVHMMLYTVTDWLGLVPVAVCLCMGAVGLVQLIRRRSLLRVDADILLLGGYYILVIAGYLFFEMVPINYRPIPIDGVMEASYPSSTALLVLSVMPTLEFQLARRVRSMRVRTAASVFSRSAGVSAVERWKTSSNRPHFENDLATTAAFCTVLSTTSLGPGFAATWSVNSSTESGAAIVSNRTRVRS